MTDSFIDWQLARRTAMRSAGRDSYTGAFHRKGLASEFAECTAQAEELVEDCTGLRSLSGRARSRLINRAGWVDANIASFDRLLRPITDKMTDKMKARQDTATSRLETMAAPLTQTTAPLTRRLVGIEFGMVMGWMSTRVLGQYDLLVMEDERPEEQDIVYYVAPNVLTLENRYAFDPSQFRLWLALHEVTHRVQFTGVSWLRGHFLKLVETAVGSVDPDPKRFVHALHRTAEARRKGEDPLAAGGLPALLATEEQFDKFNQLAGLMALLEGHGDVVMSRAGRGLIPKAARFRRVISRRRKSAGGISKLVQRLTGIDAKIGQYAAGENFIKRVETSGGPDLLNRVWTAPEYLPDMDEIRSPEDWVKRVNALKSELLPTK